MIEIFSNTLGDEELEAVRGVFASHWLGRGAHCTAFEDEFAAHLGTDHTLLFNSCTSATGVLLDLLDLQPGDEVLVPAVQFVGVSNAIRERGGRVAWVDVDPHTLNVDPASILDHRNEKTRALFMLHYGGHPADMDGVLQTSAGLYVFEDAANAISSTYKDWACGTLADAGVWSFDAMKILCMGDGGALWLREPIARHKAEMLRYFGMPLKASSGVDAREKNERWWEFTVEMPGARHISNDVLAAVGRVQLGKLPGFIARRRKIWEAYLIGLAGVGDLRLPPEPLPGCTTSYYLYWVQTERRDELARFLLERGIYTTFRYFPVNYAYREPADLPGADYAARVTLNLPLHQNLTYDDVEQVIDGVRAFFGS